MTIGLNFFKILYKALLGLGMMIEVNVLRCNGQCPKFIQVLAILVMFLKYDKL